MEKQQSHAVPPSMYMPRQFASEQLDDALILMREHPLATLTSVDGDGFPFVSYLPLHVQVGEGGELTLWGHLSRANPHWKMLQSNSAFPKMIAFERKPKSAFGLLLCSVVPLVGWQQTADQQKIRQLASRLKVHPL